ncbi:hypothetical protein Pla52o_47580 [Novipirellula galeiformis]|uniref:Uncharacterized protein n=1 Tax=Novipirellula galeiformis TaxID=2528004 RepID=A0A5C6C7W8_9BACT|nr:hypothetical protein Pla52o_47580 [Novipirellula galeiformis]
MPSIPVANRKKEGGDRAVEKSARHECAGLASLLRYEARCVLVRFSLPLAKTRYSCGGVLKMRSPASPSPGTMNDCSFNSGSTVAT